MQNYTELQFFDTLTNFKFDGEKFKRLKIMVNVILIGYEKSSRYLSGIFIRDKDTAILTVLSTEMAEVYKFKRLILLDVIDKIYQE